MIDKINNYIKGKLKEGQIEQYEIYYVDQESINAEINSNKINFLSKGKVSGFSVRVFLNKKMGFASTTNLENYGECVDKAIKIAKINEKDLNFKHFAFPQKYKKITPYSKKLLNFELNDFYKFYKDYLGAIKDSNSKIDITLGTYFKDILDITIINSQGINFSQKLCDNGLAFETKLENESIEVYDESTDVLKIENLGEINERLKALSNKQKINSQEIQLLLHPRAITDFMENTFEFSISAENVQNKSSIFTNKLNEKIAHNKLTVIDNGLQKGLFKTRSFDGEGTPTQKTTIIKNGVLKNFLYDNYTALKDNKKSSGNASRGLATPPKISSTNLIISTGNKSYDQLIASIDKGVIVRGVLGSHTMNEATGDFSFGVTEGNYIEKGGIKHSLKDVMIAGNFYNLLKDIEAVGKKIEHHYSGYYIPAILFPKIKVIGK